MRHFCDNDLSLSKTAKKLQDKLNKKIMKALSVKLIKRKSKGGHSLILVYYFGVKQLPNGTQKVIRKYESLKLFISTKKNKSIKEKEIDLEIERKALERLYDRQLAILKSEVDENSILPVQSHQEFLINYFSKLAEEKRDSKGNYENWKSSLKHLTNYLESKNMSSILVSELTSGIIIDFKKYLSNAKNAYGKDLAKNTKSSYFEKFKSTVRKAIESELIPKNILTGVKGLKTENSFKEYLTETEVKSLIAGECKIPVLKDAFLFSCMSGIRWSDLVKLTWEEVKFESDGIKIVFRQKKTKKEEYHFINSGAAVFLGKKTDEQKVFPGLKYSGYFNNKLREWVRSSGITDKHITFHSARHTYCCALLDQGIDIFTVSKMMGHSDIKNTMIYSKIVDKKREAAANTIFKFK